MNFIPKGRGQDKRSQNRLSADQIIEYEMHGMSVLAVLIKNVKKKWLVLNEQDKQLPLAPERIYLLPAKIPQPNWTSSKKTGFLKQLSLKAQNKQKTLELESVWKKALEKSKAQSVSELTKDIFKSDQIIQHLALRRALLQDKTFFTRKGNNFAPKNEKEVEKLLEKAKEAEKRKKELEELTEALIKKSEDNSAELPETIEIIEDLSVWGTKNESSKAAKEVLNKCKEKLKLELSGKPADQALKFLTDIGHFSSDQNLSLVRYKINKNYPEETTEEINNLPPHSAENREDLSSLLSLSIDGKGTKDIDDALSFQASSDDGILGELFVHISDVSSLIRPDSALYELAFKRASSVYCADDKIHMLPETASESILSLIEGEERQALTFSAIIKESGELLEQKVRPSFIKVDNNLEFDLANEVISGNQVELPEDIKEVILNLQKCSTLLSLKRKENGSSQINRKDLVAKLHPEGTESKRIFLAPSFEDSPAFNLVSEMMILANQIAAGFAQDNNIPLLFRSQEASTEDITKSLEKIPEGLAREHFIKGSFKRSVTSTEPKPHSGLGLNAYTQITSPIRRAIDLINQQQITEFISKNEAVYKALELTEKFKELETPLERVSLVQHERGRFWFINYLIQEDIKNLEATIVKESGPKPIAELKISKTNTGFKPKEKKKKGESRLGEEITLNIEQINPQRGVLRLTESKESV